MDLTMAQPTSVSFPHWVRALLLSWIDLLPPISKALTTMKALTAALTKPENFMPYCHIAPA